jgi:hypothetical protein
MKTLYHALDRNRSGFIDLGDLDPVAESEIQTFKDLCCEKYGNILDAWRGRAAQDGDVG